MECIRRRLRSFLGEDIDLQDEFQLRTIAFIHKVRLGFGSCAKRDWKDTSNLQGCAPGKLMDNAFANIELEPSIRSPKPKEHIHH